MSDISFDFGTDPGDDISFDLGGAPGGTPFLGTDAPVTYNTVTRRVGLAYDEDTLGLDEEDRLTVIGGGGSLSAGITDIEPFEPFEGIFAYELPVPSTKTLTRLVTPGGPGIAVLVVPSSGDTFDWLISLPAHEWDGPLVFSTGVGEGTVTPEVIGFTPGDLTEGALLHLWGEPGDWFVSYHTDLPGQIPTLANFQRPTVIFSRLHFGDGVAEDIDPGTDELLFPLDETPWSSPAGSYANAPIIDGLPWRGGTILVMGQPSFEQNGPWDLVYDDGDETWSVVRPAALNGWVDDSLIVEGMTFWVGSGEQFNNTHWTPNWSESIAPGEFGVVNPVYASIDALEGRDAADGEVLTRDSTADRGYSWQEAPGGVDLSDATPVANGGAGSAGTSDDAARADHSHPTTQLRARRTTTLSRNSTTTPADDDVLVVAVAANTIYRLEALLIFSCSSDSIDANIGVTAPSGATIDVGVHGVAISSTGSAGATRSVSLNSSSDTADTGVYGSGVRTQVLAVGLVEIGSTSGNVAIKWAQRSSSGTDLTLNRNSTLLLTPV